MAPTPCLPILTPPRYCLWFGWRVGDDLRINTSAGKVLGQVLVHEDCCGLCVHPQVKMVKGEWTWIQAQWTVSHMVTGHRILPNYLHPAKAMVVGAALGEMALARGLRWDADVKDIEGNDAYMTIVRDLTRWIQPSMSLVSIIDTLDQMMR